MSDPNFTGNYKWYYASSANPPTWTELDGCVPNSNIGGTNRRAFTVPITDLNGTSFVGKYIMAERLHNNIADIRSNIIGPIQQGDISGLVIINGTPKTGIKFTATSDSNFSGDYEWYSFSTPEIPLLIYGWMNLYKSYAENHSGANRSEFTIPNDGLLGQYIMAKRRNHMNGQDVWSNIIGPIQLAK